jgi:hypothetical protein
MKSRLLILCVIVVSISAGTLFVVTNNVGGYSYTPVDCTIKEIFGYFSKENPFDPNSKEFTDEESLKLLTGCLKISHPAQLQ